MDVVFDFIEHLDGHDSKFFGLFSPQIVQLFDEHFFIFVVLFEVNAFVFKFFEDGLNSD